MTHLGYLKHKLWQKKRFRFRFDSRPLKIRNHFDLLTCRWHATYRWKDFDKGYNFVLDFTLIRGLDKTLWASKVMGVPILGILGLQLGILRQNDIWVLAVWPSIENNIEGKVMVSPKSGPWWVLWVCVCVSFVRAPKVLQLCTNQLVIGLCRSMWIIDLLVTCLSPHPGALAHPFIPKVLWAREHTPTPYPFVIFTLDM